MQTNQKKVKWIIFAAIALVIVLLALNIVMLVSISNQNKKLEEQRQQIETLQNKNEYYGNRGRT
ncbi:MAG: hypothetical protein MJ152_03365 [Clostridia bacterium]|nr:hypothetical protein [Clostridia bacterium]